jgi:hypothetical protein
VSVKTGPLDAKSGHRQLCSISSHARATTALRKGQDHRTLIRKTIRVDIAIRALSPAINDPTTAVQAIDQIEDLLRRLGRAFAVLRLTTNSHFVTWRALHHYGCLRTRGTIHSAGI